jgi:nucleoside-diphosphate-sugar epimerase
MRVLFIGGTGNISSACVEEALARGHHVTVLNRGRREWAFSQPVTCIEGDRNDASLLRKVASEGRYDVVADFICMLPEQIAPAVAAFAGRVGQYIFISSASVYQKPPKHYIVTEETPLANQYWEYSRRKIACEERLRQDGQALALPFTIVRPSYTFGPTFIPSGAAGHGYTVVGRMRRGAPIISHGDGTSLWVMTYHTDFASAFVGLFGNPAALGEAFHITSDEVLTWDQIYHIVAEEAGCTPRIVHIASETIAALQPEWGPGLLGDKMYSFVLDNSKIKRVVPGYSARVSFREGIRRALAWHDADPSRQKEDLETSHRMDEVIAEYSKLRKRHEEQT